ncbi:nucleotide sugar dehydrogenase [Desulfohalovibrio reitneri]|uniref:nucleotide sugar dehydrogenase n=1 Tax=Desulfohalovibrio reitneri TaxID=1307759 RepID=UPI0004A71128|nr:nucleotide sugar dehydrogenase [Desulfohalovibrio reitneri]
MITFEELREHRSPVAVVGLGYVGLPLAVALCKHFKVLGFDVSAERVRQLRAGDDRTAEVDSESLAGADIDYTTDPARLREAGMVVVAVPTPIDSNRRPDLHPVRSASKAVGGNLRQGAVVVFESTVYPGLTEEICGPIIEEASGLRAGEDFFLGYSPERINPGDKIHTLSTIVKVVAGQTDETADLLERFYGTVVEAGIHRASSIRVAEAAKVIENTQRDINIALMNELSLIFERLGIDTTEVLRAAGTKWNFLPFSPGLVGGHCIGVDPYYLTHKAEETGYHPQMILAGRRINDSMGKHVAEACVKLLIKNGAIVNTARVGVLGLTFKENVPDLRNTRVTDIVAELEDFGCRVLVHDPQADPVEARHECGLELTPLEGMTGLDALVLAVPHREYLALGTDELSRFYADGKARVLLDIKAALDPDVLRAEGFTIWRL